MSGIAAVLRFDCKPVEPDMIRRMTGTMAYRGADGVSHWSGEGAALGHCQFYTTAESLEERQPLADPSGRFHLVMDGWLANPDELRAELEARGVGLRDRSDAELVLRAWQTWQDRFVDHIEGEWAFLVWDSRERRAFAARDHVGLRPLHWHWDGKRLIVASDINGVLAAGDIERALNPGMIAEHLAFQIRSRDETLWQGVMRLPGAHALTVDAGGPKAARYWLPPLEVGLRYAREEEYHEHYRELLAESVRSASRTHLPLACEVSGGLDSSAVFALARRELLAGRLPAPSLRGYTYSFPPGGPEDESEYAEAVAQHLGVTLTKVTPFLPDFDWFVERSRSDCDMLLPPNAAMSVNIARAARADGARVLRASSARMKRITSPSEGNRPPCRRSISASIASLLRVPSTSARSAARAVPSGLRRRGPSAVPSRPPGARGRLAKVDWRSRWPVRGLRAVHEMIPSSCRIFTATSCRTEEYVDANGVTRTRNRCAGGFLLGGAGLGVGGTALLGGLAIGAVAMAASSSSAESP